MGSRDEIELGQSGGPKSYLKTLPREPRADAAVRLKCGSGFASCTTSCAPPLPGLWFPQHPRTGAAHPASTGGSTTCLTIVRELDAPRPSRCPSPFSTRPSAPKFIQDRLYRASLFFIAASFPRTHVSSFTWAPNPSRGIPRRCCRACSTTKYRRSAQDLVIPPPERVLQMG